jgi:glutamyl-tRNA synthetase
VLLPRPTRIDRPLSNPSDRLQIVSGRFAPSPTGDLHVGNLRTALLAWLLARSERRGFLVRMEDLDRANASAEHERRQLDDLLALGIDHDGEVVRQSERFDVYRDVLARLDAAGLVYPCWCSRREIAEEIESAAGAPHGEAAVAAPVGDVSIEVPVRAYPGTCRELTSVQRAEREATGRPPALRLRASDAVVEVHDRIWGTRRGLVDDVVLRRGDGVPAYNLAVVVDDQLQGVTQVVRGDDLLSSTPRHVHLQRLLGFPVPDYVHVPLVVGDDGERLAKRHGAVTRHDLVGLGIDAPRLLASLARSLGVEVADGVAVAAELLDGGFELTRVPTRPVALDEVVDLPRSEP